MEKQGVYVIVLLIVAMFLFVVFTNPSDNKNLTGFAVGDNVTDTNTTTTDTNTTVEVDVAETNTTTETNTTVEVNVTETNTTEAASTIESCVEDWVCGSWTDCSGSSQSRTCTDLTSCGTEENKPIESQSCTVEETNTETETQTETETETEAETETATETLSQVDQILKDLEAKGLLEGSQPEGEIINQPTGGLDEGDVQTITGGVVGDGNETCEGCLIGDTCYSINKRKSDQYCAGENIWMNQTALNESCTENYECDSNNCRDGTCNKFSLMKFIADWFKGLFKFEINFNMTSNNTTEIVSDI